MRIERKTPPEKRRLTRRVVAGLACVTAAIVAVMAIAIPMGARADAPVFVNGLANGTLRISKSTTGVNPDPSKKFKLHVKLVAPDGASTDGEYRVTRTATYKVAFNPNGGTGAMDELMGALGEAVTLPASAFKRNGWTFAGWNDRQDGTGTAYGAGAAFSSRSRGTTTLYAMWESRTISFDANGGEGSMADQHVGIGESATIDANKFARSGWYFAGWNTETDGSGTAYLDRGAVSPTGDMTLHAQWSKRRVDYRRPIRYSFYPWTGRYSAFSDFIDFYLCLYDSSGNRLAYLYCYGHSGRRNEQSNTWPAVIPTDGAIRVELVFKKGGAYTSPFTGATVNGVNLVDTVTNIVSPIPSRGAAGTSTHTLAATLNIDPSVEGDVTLVFRGMGF